MWLLPLGNLSILRILVGTDDDAYDVDDLPNEEPTGGDKLNNSGDDLAGVEAVQTTEADDEEKAGQDQRDGARTG